MSDAARWISVGELAESFGSDSYAPPRTAGLAGSVHTLHFEDGIVTEYRFLSGSRLSWTLGGLGGDGPRAGEAEYFAFEVRPGIYFIDYVPAASRPTAISLVLDLTRGMATSLTAHLPGSADVGESLAARIARGDELTAVTAEFASASVDEGFTASTPRHAPTADLVGRRVEYTYGPTERYEHIYLNEEYYTWHCLAGSEKAWPTRIGATISSLETIFISSCGGRR